MNKAPLIITKYYDYLLYVIPQVAKFPRSERYSIGVRLEGLSFDILELLLEAAYSKNKTALLATTNVKLEKLRYYFRLCKDSKLMSLQKYEVLSKKITEIGTQLGGWIKQQRSRSI